MIESFLSRIILQLLCCYSKLRRKREEKGLLRRPLLGPFYVGAQNSLNRCKPFMDVYSEKNKNYTGLRNEPRDISTMSRQTALFKNVEGQTR